VTGGEGGVKYVAGSGSSVTFNLRSVAGHFTDRAADPVTLLDDGFRRSEGELLRPGASPASPRSTDGSPGSITTRVIRRAGLYRFRGAARISMGAHGKVSLNLAMSRDLQPWQDSFPSYRVTSGCRSDQDGGSAPGPR